MAINKKLIHFKNYSDFNSKKLSANEQNTQYTLGVDGVLTTGAPDILYQSICWIKDSKKMWTHGTLYDCSGAGGDINASSLLVIGDSDDEVKANFRAFVNGTASADYYIGSVHVNGGIIFGIVRPVIRPAVSGGGGEFEVTGYPDSGGSTSKFIKADCRCSSDGVITTTLKYVLDSKQDVIEDLGAIRAKAEKGATAVQPDDIKDNGYVIANGILDDEDHYWHLPNSTANEEQYTLASKADIKNGVYVADFTMDSLMMGMQEQEQISCDIPSLVAAMKANKVILVRQNKSSDYKGAFVLNGFVEDLLYFSIVDTNGTVLCCETSYVNGTCIDGRDLYVKTWQDPITDLEAIRRGAAKGATAVQIYQFGEMEAIQTQGFEGSLNGKLYALPDEATGDEDDIIATKQTLKTINGESIFGSGDITISRDYLPLTGGSMTGPISFTDNSKVNSLGVKSLDMHRPVKLAMLEDNREIVGIKQGITTNKLFEFDFITAFSSG